MTQTPEKRSMSGKSSQVSRCGRTCGVYWQGRVWVVGPSGATGTWVSFSVILILVDTSLAGCFELLSLAPSTIVALSLSEPVSACGSCHWKTSVLPLGDPDGAKRRIDTVVPRPSVCRTWAYCRLACRGWTSSTKGSLLLVRTWRLRRTGPGVNSQVSIDPPVNDCLSNLKKLSCGVQLVAVRNRDRRECSVSGSTSCQCVTGRPWVLRPRL